MKWRMPVIAMTENRRLALFALAAVIGLIIAGHSLFTAKGTTTIFVPPEAAATVNGAPISRDELEAGVQALYEVSIAEASKAQRDEVLNSVIRDELYVQRARELDTASFDSDVRASYQRATQQFLAAKALAHGVSEDKARAYYEANKNRYATEGMMNVVDFVFPAAAADTVSGIAAALRQGQGKPEAAAGFGGKDSARIADDQFYFAARAKLGDQLFAAARALSDGSVSPPITAPDGVHMLYMINNQLPRPRPFESVRILVMDDVNLRVELRAGGGDDSALRKGADIKIAEDLK
jgi:parvulin-like peptidyl-prolyl isomerase